MLRLRIAAEAPLRRRMPACTETADRCRDPGSLSRPRIGVEAPWQTWGLSVDAVSQCQEPRDARRGPLRKEPPTPQRRMPARTETLDRCRDPASVLEPHGRRGVSVWTWCLNVRSRATRDVTPRKEPPAQGAPRRRGAACRRAPRPWIAVETPYRCWSPMADVGSQCGCGVSASGAARRATPRNARRGQPRKEPPAQGAPCARQARPRTASQRPHDPAAPAPKRGARFSWNAAKPSR